jgi:hypothetical protein
VKPEPGCSSAVNVDSEKGTASSMPNEVYVPNKQKVVHTQATMEKGAGMCGDSTNKNVILTNSDTHPNYSSAKDENN